MDDRSIFGGNDGKCALLSLSHKSKCGRYTQSFFLRLRAEYDINHHIINTTIAFATSCQFIRVYHGRFEQVNVKLVNHCKKKYKPDQVYVTERILRKIPDKFLQGLGEIQFFDESHDPIIKYVPARNRNGSSIIKIYMGGFCKKSSYSLFLYNFVINSTICEHIVTALQPGSQDSEILSYRKGRYNPKWLYLRWGTPLIWVLNIFSLAVDNSSALKRWLNRRMLEVIRKIDNAWETVFCGIIKQWAPKFFRKSAYPPAPPTQGFQHLVPHQSAKICLDYAKLQVPFILVILWNTTAYHIPKADASMTKSVGCPCMGERRCAKTGCTETIQALSGLMICNLT